ncbi:MAG: hypothetical protein F6K31_05030 [Symploca sp. SIO2G7]|nr:hypothetical protein [Symploca sp. SIO2G7]
MTTKRREVRFFPDEEHLDILESLQRVCGFTAISSAVKYLITVYGAAEVARVRKLQQGGIFPASPAHCSSASKPTEN